MKKFFFEAKTQEGKRQTGEMEASDVFELAKILKKEGLFLIRAKEKKEEKKKISFFSFSRVSITEKLFFTRNLKIMISAGVPLVKAILTLSNQTKSRVFKKSLSEIAQKISKGEALSRALSHYPNIFSELYQNMIKVGEEGGKLEEVLEILAVQMEKEHELKSKVKTAMIYPAVVISAMVGVGFLMLVLVIPKLAATFKELQIQLPLTTQIVIFLGMALKNYWWGIFFGIFLFVLILIRVLKTKVGKKIFDQILFKIPVISEIVKKNNSAMTARTLSALISAGVSLPRSLEICARTLGNIFYQEALIKGSERVKSGEKLSQVLREYQKFIPLTLITMVEVGEETGETGKILEKLANFYEEEVSNITKNLASVIEPILLLLVGAAVGFFAISMVQPMYSMLQAIE